MIQQEIIFNKTIYTSQNINEFLEYVINKKKILISLNAEMLINEDDKLNEIICENIGYADGVGAILALERKGAKSIKLPGVELWLELIKNYNSNKSFYLIGSTQEVVSKTVEKLKVEFKKINIEGFWNGYFDDNIKQDIINDIINKKPDVIFVAMGAPKQEYFMKELHDIYPAIYMGLGGSFDIYSGLKKRAPAFFIQLKTEWLYRLIKEPTRVKRQLVLFKFFFLLLLKKL